jgi:predicted 3-demethylubiquinone-9 3-methyltransferase (glyoxalase superfamily)
MPAITPHLWFDHNAREAAEFYARIFPNSTVAGGLVSPADTPSGERGYEVVVPFTLDGTAFAGINGGPQFQFSEAISFQIDCADQTEVDYYWESLTADGGEPGQCGWLKDRFGVSWQVVPRQLGDYLGGPDAAGAQRAMECMLEQTRIIVEDLKAAYEGR